MGRDRAKKDYTMNTNKQILIALCLMGILGASVSLNAMTPAQADSDDSSTHVEDEDSKETFEAFEVRQAQLAASYAQERAAEGQEMNVLLSEAGYPEQPVKQERLRKLLSRGENINALLRKAVEKEDAAMVRELLTQQADPNSTIDETKKTLFRAAFDMGNVSIAHMLVITQRKDRLPKHDLHALKKVRATLANLMINDLVSKNNNAKAVEIACEIKEDEIALRLAATPPVRSIQDYAELYLPISGADSDAEIIRKAQMKISNNEVTVRTNAVTLCGPEVAQIAMSLDLGPQSRPEKSMSYLRDAINAGQKDTVEMLMSLGADMQALLKAYANGSLPAGSEKIKKIAREYKLDSNITYDLLYWLMKQPVGSQEKEASYRTLMEVLIFSGAYLSDQELDELYVGHSVHFRRVDRANSSYAKRVEMYQAAIEDILYALLSMTATAA